MASYVVHGIFVLLGLTVLRYTVFTLMLRCKFTTPFDAYPSSDPEIVLPRCTNRFRQVDSFLTTREFELLAIGQHNGLNFNMDFAVYLCRQWNLFATLVTTQMLDREKITSVAFHKFYQEGETTVTNRAMRQFLPSSNCQSCFLPQVDNCDDLLNFMHRMVAITDTQYTPVEIPWGEEYVYYTSLGKHNHADRINRGWMRLMGHNQLGLTLWGAFLSSLLLSWPGTWLQEKYGEYQTKKILRKIGVDPIPTR